MLTTLTVVNDCLATLGETPLLSLEEDHPFLSSALRILDVVNAREQAKGWWFNREIITLLPDSGSGFIYLPTDAISINPIDDSLPFVARGRKLYNSAPVAGQDGYVFTNKVQVRMTRLLPYEDIPVHAQVLISVGTVLDFQSGYDADAIKQRKSDSDYSKAWLHLSAEETRNRGANLLNRPSSAYVMQSMAPPYLRT